MLATRANTKELLVHNWNKDIITECTFKINPLASSLHLNVHFKSFDTIVYRLLSQTSLVIEFDTVQILFSINYFMEKKIQKTIAKEVKDFASISTRIYTIVYGRICCIVLFFIFICLLYFVFYPHFSTKTASVFVPR